MARMVIGDDLMANNKLNERELAAKKILQEMGWEPERINITYYNKGMPDFKCSENRYVEVKPSGFSDGDQMMRWEELSRQGNKFYIFVLYDKYYTIIEFKLRTKIIKEGVIE